MKVRVMVLICVFFVFFYGTGAYGQDATSPVHQENLMPLLSGNNTKPATPSTVPGKPASPARPAASAGANATVSGKYDPEATAMLLNYCRESLYKIVEYNDRSVLDEEYNKLVNNIDITRIQDDEAAQLIEALLTELNLLKLDEAQKQFLTDAYNKTLQSGIIDAFKKVKGFDTKMIAAAQANSAATMACKAIVFIATGISNWKSGLARMQNEASMHMLQLKAEELKRLTVLRTQFFDTEYKLYKRYGLPDHLNLKEVQMAQYIKVLADEDGPRRFERLERLKDDFDAFPPFWYQIGKAAEESNKRDIALDYYAHFEKIQTHVFREDQDYVSLCMHRILMRNYDTEKEAVRRDLKIIESNTKYYYKWESILFAALTYYQIGDVENGRRLIRMSINEGYAIELHEEILREMESEAAKTNLAETAQDLVEKSDIKALEAIAKVGPGKQLEALRAMGKMITGITVSMEARSRTGQNMTYLVPGYNIYSVGRSVFKGDAYNDNCIVHMSSEWFTDGKPKVRFVYKGRTFKPSSISVEKKAGLAHITFSRVFEEEDILKKGLTYPVTVRIESRSTALGIEFEVKKVTPQMQKLRPELSLDAPFFDMQMVTFEDRHFLVENGILMDAQ